MNKIQFKEFISYFMIARSGNYDVPEYIMIDCYDYFNQYNKMYPLDCYEAVLKCKWHEDDPEYYLCDKDMSVIEKIIDGYGYYNLSQDELLLIKQKYEYRLSYEKMINSYKARRKKENTILQNKKLRKKVFDKYGYSCNYCNSEDDLSIDHIVPVLKGGDSNINNLQILCRSCNSRKGVKNA